MRINNQPIPALHKAYEQQKKAGVPSSVGAGKKSDDLKLSAEARLWSVAAKALRELPEPSRNLSELQKAVATGTYQVSNEEIAEKIWQENGFDLKI